MASPGWRRVRCSWTAPSACAGSRCWAPWTRPAPCTCRPSWNCWFPPGLRRLPPGWWAFLLRSQDAEGRLLPEGALDPALPWPQLQAQAGPLALDGLPGGLGPPSRRALAGGARRGGGCWIPACGPGRGAPAPRPAGLEPLAPGGLAGGVPDPPQAAFLRLELAEGQPEGWRDALAADIREAPHRPAPPPLSGQATWDRIRMRWGGEAAPTAPGYPDWGTRAHPCADPFHWMAEGLRADRACDPEASLRAFTLAHAHFLRLGAPGWAERAASNAAPPRPQVGRPARPRPLERPARSPAPALAGPGGGPAGGGEPHTGRRPGPDPPPGEGPSRISRGLGSPGQPRGRPGTVGPGAGRPGPCPGPPLRPLPARPSSAPWRRRHRPDADPETRLSWEAHRLFRGTAIPVPSGRPGRACPTQIMCLELGLQVLERLPDLRRAEALLALQAIADRAPFGPAPGAPRGPVAAPEAAPSLAAHDPAGSLAGPADHPHLAGLGGEAASTPWAPASRRRRTP